MEILPVGAELFHADRTDRQTDRHDEADNNYEYNQRDATI